MAKLINCVCGQIVRGETDEELLRNADRHIEEVHPDLLGRFSHADFLAMAEEA